MKDLTKKKERNVKGWLLGVLSLSLLLISCRSPWDTRPLTDEEIVDQVYGRQAEVKFNDQGRVVEIRCPPPRGDAPWRFIYSKTCQVKEPLPPQIWQLTELRVLVIVGNGEQSVTLLPEIKSLKKLETFILQGTNLTYLPPEIGELRRLQWLDLSNNNLTALPPEIGQLTDLSYLSLSRNNIPTLPVEIGRLTNLKKLIVSQNYITSLPAEIGLLINLEELWLSYNNLTTLPPEIEKLRETGTKIVP